jgi:hypothetical protein
MTCGGLCGSFPLFFCRSSVSCLPCFAPLPVDLLKIDMLRNRLYIFTRMQILYLKLVFCSVKLKADLGSEVFFDERPDSCNYRKRAGHR